MPSPPPTPQEGSARLASGPTPENRLGLDYLAEAGRFRATAKPIIDMHAHIVGGEASRVYAEVASAFGVGLTYSMTPIDQAGEVRRVLGERVRFIAVPNWGDAGGDPAYAWREGFLSNIQRFHDEFGSRIVKFWNSPRLRDRFPGPEGAALTELDGDWRIRHAALAEQLGMMFLVHVADPDLWFRTMYRDVGRYGRKADQYRGLERMLDRFAGPWIVAHMGGWPENLEFLSSLLARHGNVNLDCSATKWMVRELSRHPRGAVAEFMSAWKGRIIFGSDVVTSDDHLRAAKSNAGHPKADQADSPARAFDLYAGRYWALRTLLETSYEGESPIADPDLAMEDPPRHGAMSAPTLRGLRLPADVLESVYWGAATDLLRRVDPVRAWE